MLPTPETTFWLSSSRLIPDSLRRTRRTNSASSNSGSSGSRAMCAISGGTTPPPSETASPPNIRWSTNRSSRPGWSGPRTIRTRRCLSSGTPGGCTSIWPLMPRWPSRASPLSRESQRYLPRRWAPTKVRPVNRAAKSSGPPACRRTGRGCSTSTEVIGRSSTWFSRPRRTTSTSGSSGIVGRGGGSRRGRHGGLRELRAQRAVGRLGRLLLGLLLRPADAVAVHPALHPDAGGERLHVVGSLVLDEVLRDTEAVQRAELLQARLPVQPRAHGGGRLHHRVEEQVHGAGGVLEAAGEVDRPDQRLDRVGEDRGLLAAPGRLLPLAEVDVDAEPDRAGDLGERARVDDGGAQLGQPALGEVGVLEVERLGDDHAEHRVAEELQALVGRQVAVLVGVGAVRQGKLEQLGIQGGITECVTELVGLDRACG